MAIVTRPPDSVPTGSEPNWQTVMQQAIRHLRQLWRELRLPGEPTDRAGRAAADFPVFVPRPFLQRMKPGDLHDPLLRQVLPLDRELDSVAEFQLDPVGDQPAQSRPGLLQKYQGRALLIATGNCAIHCRYCFRRHFPYESAPRQLAEWESVWQTLADDDSVREVILSGGDPLTLSDRRLQTMVQRLENIPHVKRLRIHTRLPIMIPQRVTRELLECLQSSRLQVICVLHANHAAELDADVSAAVQRLAAAGIMLLNQAVLLRSINDSVDAQVELSEQLLAMHVLPYYLHQLDRVQGAAHFEVTEQQGLEILRGMQAQLPGYGVPRYVRERPGGDSKELILF